MATVKTAAEEATSPVSVADDILTENEESDEEDFDARVFEKRCKLGLKLKMCLRALASMDSICSRVSLDCRNFFQVRFSF